MALPGRFPRSRRKRFDRWEVPRREASGTFWIAGFFNHFGKAVQSSHGKLQIFFSTAAQGNKCKWVNVRIWQDWCSGDWAQLFFPSNYSLLSSASFSWHRTVSTHQHGLIGKSKSRSPSACVVPHCSIPHAHLHRVPSPGNGVSIIASFQYLLKCFSEFSACPFPASCHKGLGRPKHCFNATGRAQATETQPKSCVLRSLRTGSFKSQSSTSKCVKAAECNSMQQRIASNTRVALDLGQRMQHSIAAEQLVTTHEPAKIQWRVPAQFAGQSTSLKERRPLWESKWKEKELKSAWCPESCPWFVCDCPLMSIVDCWQRHGIVWNKVFSALFLFVSQCCNNQAFCAPCLPSSIPSIAASTPDTRSEKPRHYQRFRRQP